MSSNPKYLSPKTYDFLLNILQSYKMFHPGPYRARLPSIRPGAHNSIECIRHTLLLPYIAVINLYNTVYQNMRGCNKFTLDIGVDKCDVS